MWLSIIGFLTILIIVLLLLSGRVTPIVPLVLIPILGALVTGFGPSAMNEFFSSGLDDVISVAIMFIFAILFFGIMQDTGLFDPLINGLIAVSRGNVIAISIGTVFIAALAQLDGSGASTFLITIPALLPLYQRLQMSPYLLLLLISGSASIMNMMPWAGPLGRSATVLDVDVISLWRPLIPVQVIGMLLMVGLAILLGYREIRRIQKKSTVKSQHTKAVSIDEEQTTAVQSTSEKDQSLTRPKLLWANLIITIAVITVLVSDLLDPGFAFLIGVTIALPINYPNLNEQMGRIRSHAPNALMMASIIIAAGVFLGVLEGTGMLNSIAKDIVHVIPSFVAPYLHLIIGLFGVPFDLLLSTDAYYYALLPVVEKIASGFGLESLSTAYAMIIGNIVGTFISPFSPALWLALGLANLEMGRHIRYSIGWTWGLSIILVIIATLIGVISV